jgi:hypothetical protein
MQASLFEDIEYSCVSFVAPVTKNSGFGFAMQYVNYGTLDKTDNNGFSIGTFAPTDKLVSIGYGYNLGTSRLGITGKYIDSTITKNAKTYAFDAGLNCDISKSVRLAIAVKNLGEGLKYKEVRDSLPTSLDIGLACDLNKNLLMAVEAKKSKDNDLISSIGFEYKTNVLKDIKTTTRFGYTDRTKDIDKVMGVSFGFGLVYKKYKIDYSYTPSGDFGNTQTLTFGINI